MNEVILVRQGNQLLEKYLCEANVIRSFANRLAICCCTSRSVPDVRCSPDKPETYKPLSGKVMLGHWLKWKLCANIYIGLMGPLASATLPEPQIPSAHSPMLCDDAYIWLSFCLFFLFFIKMVKL